jgi:amino acid adenylation domain-containing protein
MSEHRIDDAYELSPLQQGMLFHSLAAPASGLYLITVDYTLGGPLDAGALLRAWDALIARNDVLRTSFDWQVANRPIQVVNGQVDGTLRLDDWRGVSSDIQAQRLGGLVEQQRAPMPLDKAPLMRAALVRVADAEWRLIWTFHHILLEGWSVALLVKQLAALYEIERGGKAPLPPAPRYRDYLDWVRDQDLGAAATYWRRTLAGFQGATSLDGRAAAAGHAETVRHQRYQHVLGKALGRRLHAFAREQRVTVNTILQGAWALLLSRYSGSGDVVFGAVVSGREVDVPGVENVVGLCVNTLPMRVRINTGAAAGEWLRELQAMQAAMRQYEWTSLVQVRGWSDVAAAQPLFETIFAYENWAGDQAIAALGDVSLTAAASIQGGTGYPLAVAVLPGASPSATFEYDAARFDEAFVARLARQFSATVAALCDDSARRLDEISSIDRAERAEVVEEWNATTSPYPRDASIAELFTDVASRHAGSIAVEYADATLTYAELDARSNRLAHHLQTLGVGPDTLVGLCTERSAAMIVAMVGIIKAGGAYVPLDPAYPGERLAAMADDAALGVVITQQSLEDVVPIRSGCTRVRIDADWADIGSGGDAPVCAPVTASHLAYVIYTSGSTGTPKGAAIPHRGVVRLVRDTNYISIEPDDRIAQASSSSFDAATFEIWGALLNGARVVGISKETALSADRFASELDTRGVTTLFVTTALFNVLSQKAPAVFTRLRHLLFGGEAVDPTAVRRILREAAPQRLLHVYGPTETTTYASWYVVRGVADGATTIPIGRGIAQTQLYVLDARLQPVGAGMPGELYVGGDGGARGYLNRPDTTAERFIPDPFSTHAGARMYRTGDLVRWTPDGQIVFIGRLDGQVKIRGFRMELGEIEAALTSHPAVLQAVVAPFGSGADKRLGAWVVLRTEAAPDIADQLREHARRQLPEYMVPAAFTWLDTIPLNANGKVDKEKLPQPTSDRQLNLAYVAPRGAIEESIAAIWQELLGIERVGVRDNLFDLGAHSLLIIQAHARIVAEIGVSIPIVALFEFPTIEALAGRIVTLQSEGDAPVSAPRPSASAVAEESALAVIAMAGRFPGAPDVETFWTNLRNGVEGVRTLSEDELRRAGVDELELKDPNYVRARGVLDGSELFDAAFFGYTPRDAELMDPQHRLFLECASEALERAGYNPDTYAGRIGVYAGASANSYLLNVATHPDVMASAGGLQTLIGSGSDFLPTRVSYKLNLRGPSVNVQTACSTSLVAVHQACQSLRNNECDVALAGGVSVGAPAVRGYLYAQGGIGAPDGHCRAFDAQARGTVPGHGVGIVVLKRLADAVRDGDTVHAVIRGTAINNDGAAKVGFTAPSVEGQAEVIAAAHADARVSAAEISYVEAHGTGTTLGDPIEIAALTRVFGESRDAKTCAIGSVKTNIGHLDGAAGVANLIKVVLAISHGELPPSLHFTEPNPELHLDRTPFEINTRLREWPASPRRLAGVSSFGIGGTNAHVVVEEPPPPAVTDAGHAWQLVPLSAKTPAALDTVGQRLAEYFDGATTPFADAAYTLQVGRRSFAHRRFVVARTAADAARGLSGTGGPAAVGATVEPRDRAAVFMFSGQGSQYHGMASGLYDADASFRADIDRCAELFVPLLQCDLRQVLFADDAEDSNERLKQTRLTQPALFAIEYALARFWMRCGVRPAAMIGHSIGEYVAACLAGVFSLEDAVAIVAARGRVMQEQTPGAMLAVMLPERDVASRLPADVTVAAINGPSLTVIAGLQDSIAAMEARLAADGVTVRRVETSHAFHSAMMQPAADALAREIKRFTLQPPTIPFVSNVTGTWITPEQATSGDYWARHLRQPVKFADGIRTIAADPGRVFIEVGPGRALAGFTGEIVSADVPVLASTRHQRSTDNDYAVMLDALGRAWLAGIAIDWSGLHTGIRRRRVPLPTYPFERRKYWIDRRRPAAHAGPERRAVDDWLFVPRWAAAAASMAADAGNDLKKWLVFVDEAGLGDRVVKRLIAHGHDVVVVSAATQFAGVAPSSFTIDPSRAHDYAALIRELDAAGRRPDAVAHFWGVTTDAPTGPAASARCIDRGFYSLVWLEQALAEGDPRAARRIGVVTTHARAVTPSDVVVPAKATVNGPLLVVPAERAGVTTCAIDVMLSDWLSASDAQIDALLRDLAAAPEPVVAYRDAQRFVPELEPSPLPAVPRHAHRAATPRLRPRGVYLVTGGFGGVGRSIARELAIRYQARLILVGRAGVPERAAWAHHLASHDADDRVAQSIAFIRELEGSGAEVLALGASVTDGAALRGAVQRAIERWGTIHGVIHSAGVAGGGIVHLKTREAANAVFAPKVAGTETLAAVLDDCPLDFFALCSSLTALIGGGGQVDYCAANAYLDAFAHEYTRRSGRFAVAINWDTWRDVGMAVDTVLPQSLLERRATALARGMSPAEGVDVFLRVVAHASATQVAVSTTGLARADHATLESAPASLGSHARPDGSEYVPPADDVERLIAEVWQEMIGVDRVSRTDDFFSLGGHSLLATRVIAHVKQRCGVDLSLRTFLEHPTLSGLAERVSELQWAAKSRTAAVGVADREEIEI